MNIQTSLNQAWLERHIEDCLEFANPKSGLSDSPHSLTCMTLNGLSMSQFARAKAKKAHLADMILMALATNKRWLMDNRYAAHPEVLMNWTSLMELRNLPEDKITVFGVSTYTGLCDDVRDEEIKINQTTNFRDDHAFHGGLYYIGREIADQDEYTIKAHLANMNFVDYPVSYARYPYPIRVLRHLTYDGPIAPWWVQHQPYADIKVLDTDVGIFQSHMKILIDNLLEVPVLIVDADFVPLEEAWMFPRIFKFDEQYVNLFQTINPLNGLTYGHGGPKLMKNFVLTNEVKEGQENNHSQVIADLDMTSFFAASKGMKLRPLVGAHHFCWDPFSTWRTSFREAFKLTRLLSGNLADHHRDQTRHRLHTWMGTAPGSSFRYTLHKELLSHYDRHLSRQEFDERVALSQTGAHMGSAFAALDRKEHPNVNNYEELQTIFTKTCLKREL